MSKKAEEQRKLAIDSRQRKCDQFYDELMENVQAHAQMGHMECVHLLEKDQAAPYVAALVHRLKDEGFKVRVDTETPKGKMLKFKGLHKLKQGMPDIDLTISWEK